MLSYISCFFGAWLASTRLGRFRTIVLLGGLYAAGTFMAAFASLPKTENVFLYLIGTMVLVTFGTGGIKPNIVTHGADQFDQDEPDYKNSVKSFFQYFYISINMGSMISHGFLSSTAVSGFPAFGVSVEYGFFFTYMVSASFMLLALLVFISGKPRYRPAAAVGDMGVMELFVGTLMSGSGSLKGKVALLGWALIPGIIVSSLLNAFMMSQLMQMTCLVMDIACLICLVGAHLDNSWLPESPIRQCLDCVPVLLVGNIFYGILNSSTGSSFQSEACQMDTRADPHVEDGFQFSGDFFRLANPLAIVLFTPVLVNLLYPLVQRCVGREVSTGMKVTCGYLFAISSQLVASYLERVRVSRPVSDIQSRCAPKMPDGTHIHASQMSALWMLLPYALSGMGEIMVYPVLQHVAYEGAPEEMKSLMQAFTLFAMGALPNAMASGVSQALSPLVPNNLNDGDLSSVYLINCGIGVVGLLLFWFVWKSAPKRLRSTKKVADSDSYENHENSESSSEQSGDEHPSQ